MRRTTALVVATGIALAGVGDFTLGAGNAPGKKIQPVAETAGSRSALESCPCLCYIVELYEDPEYPGYWVYYCEDHTLTSDCCSEYLETYNTVERITTELPQICGGTPDCVGYGLIAAKDTGRKKTRPHNPGLKNTYTEKDNFKTVMETEGNKPPQFDKISVVDGSEHLVKLKRRPGDDGYAIVEVCQLEIDKGLGEKNPKIWVGHEITSDSDPPTELRQIPEGAKLRSNQFQRILGEPTILNRDGQTMLDSYETALRAIVNTKEHGEHGVVIFLYKCP